MGNSNQIRISVIIPTLNEEGNILSLLSQLTQIEERIEIIVCDAGSTDSTLELTARFKGVKVICSEANRGQQMNKGASIAKGKWLWFVHADSHVNECHLNSIIRLEESEYAAGSFSLKFDKQYGLLHLYALVSKINHPMFTFGDQGIFVRKELFDELGGYKCYPIMEDVDFVKRLFKRSNFFKVDLALETSSRRFVQEGVVFRQLKNIFLLCLFRMGVHPGRLKKMY